MNGAPHRSTPGRTIPIAGRPTPAAPVDTRWRWARLVTAPHRLGFFAAAVAMAVTAAWWVSVLGGRLGGAVPPWAVPEPLAHGLALTLGFLPLFVVGFLFTAGPRWLAMPDVPASSLRRPVAGFAAGVALALAGFHASALVAAAGLAVATVAWASLTRRFVRLVRASRAADRLHATLVAAACGVGVLTMALAAGALAAGDVAWGRAATQLALWGFVAPVFAVVSHRMIPFFTASAIPALDAWRPSWLLAVMGLALAAGGAAGVVEALNGTVPVPLRVAVLAVQAPAAALMLWLALRWGLVRSLRIRLLAMLHGGFVWLGVALALGAAGHARALAGLDDAGLGLAGLHALTVGYLGATLVAMVTRVAAGHSGRPLAADDLAMALYGGVQAAAAARVAAALWPPASAPLLVVAALLWAGSAAGWAWRYGGWLGRPRVDGRPG